MNLENLVNMANQIGSFFDTMPDRPQAMTDLVTHLKRSWEPRMLRQLMAYVDEQGGSELTPIVSEAIHLHVGMLR